MKAIILTLITALFVFSAKADIINVCGIDSITLTVENYVNGTIEWQESIDTINWANIPEVSGESHTFFPTQTKYYRAVVKTSYCPPLYSAISLVQLAPIANAGTDRAIGDTSMILLGNEIPGAVGEWAILSGNGGIIDNLFNSKALLIGRNKETYTLKWTLTNACGQSSDTVSVYFEEITSKTNFIVIDNSDSIYSDSIELINGIYKIRFSDQKITPSDSMMLIGVRVNGSFLRKVNSFTILDSIYTFLTVQGTIEELFKTGVLNMGDALNQAILDGNSKLRSISAFPTRAIINENRNNKGIKLLYVNKTEESNSNRLRSLTTTSVEGGLRIPLPEMTFFKNDNSSFKMSISESYIRIDPNFVLDYSYAFPAKLTKIRFGIDNGEFEFNLKSRIELSEPISGFKSEKLIKGTTIVMLFMAGPVPVHATTNIDIKASLDISGSAGFRFEEKKYYKMNATALILGENIQSLRIEKNITETSSHEENMLGLGQISSEFKIGPEISVKAYDIVGPYLSLPAKIDLSICQNTNNDWSAEASIGYEWKLGAIAKIMGLTLFDFNYDFFSDKIMGKIKIPFLLELLSGNNQKGISGAALDKPVSLKVTTPQGIGIPFVPVRFEVGVGNGSIPQKVLYTDNKGIVNTNWSLGTNPINTLQASVLDCNNTNIENSPVTVYAFLASTPFDCSNSSLSLDMKSTNGSTYPSVSGGIGPYSYSTNGTDFSGAIPKFVETLPGSFSVWVKDKNSCIRTRTFTINKMDACSASDLSLDILNQPNILKITGVNGAPPYLYSIDNALNLTANNSFSNLSVGNHFAYVKDAKGCMFSKIFQIGALTGSSISASFPTNGATAVSVSGILFKWIAGDYAPNQTYDLYLKKELGSYGLVGSALSATNYSYNTTLSNSSKYLWKLVVKNNSLKLDSSEFSFTTASGIATKPTVPVITQPVNGATNVVLPVTFRWSTQVGDFSYDIYLDELDGTTLVGLNIAKAEYTVNNMASGKTYYWKVKIKSLISGASAVTAVQSFTTYKKEINTVTDIDGNVYHTVTIGPQVWMVENLKTTKFNDGTAIPFVTLNTAWSNLTTPGYCWYSHNEAEYKNTYGALYNWYTINTNKLAPTGWHVPSDDDWQVLIDFLGGDAVAGGKLKESGYTHWLTSGNTIYDGTNTVGFYGLPGGQRHIDYSNVASFTDMGRAGYFWSLNPTGGGIYTQVQYWYLFYSRLYFENGSYSGGDKNEGLSVRCVKN